MPTCPHCGRAGNALAPASRRGAVYSWIVVHVASGDPNSSGGDRTAPYTIATVDLDDGARMFGRLVGTAPPSADLVVEAEFYEEGAAWLVRFRGQPDGSQAAP
jgi:uncharacterized OB-fold protein